MLERFLEMDGFNKGAAHQDQLKVQRIFTNESYALLYTTVYNMCTQRAPNNWSEALYKKYGEALADYVQRNVVPVVNQRVAQRGEGGVDLLKEVLWRWENHKVYVKWMDRFFSYLDRLIFYTRFECVFTSSPLISSVFFTSSPLVLSAFSHQILCQAAVRGAPVQ